MQEDAASPSFCGEGTNTAVRRQRHPYELTVAVQHATAARTANRERAITVRDERYSQTLADDFENRHRLTRTSP